MDIEEVKRRVGDALTAFETADRYLLENNLSERCIAARLAIHLQRIFPDYQVDVEYNRAGATPKRLDVPRRALVVPDIVVHRRGPAGPNLLALELKKTTNRRGADSDRERIRAFRERLGYSYGALLQCETRPRHEPHIRVLEWSPG